MKYIKSKQEIIIPNNNNKKDLKDGVPDCV